MEKLRKFYRFLKGKYDLLALKKYTTIAGTLVFFLIMSIVPFCFWLTLLIGKLPVDIEGIFELSVFDSVKNILLYVQKEASGATTGASVVLVITTLYSSTNLFYQMRKSGEIIYDFHRKKQGLRLRVGALVLMFVIIFMFVAFLLLFAVGTFLFSRYFPKALELVADYALLGLLAFALALILNMYICPYKQKPSSFLLGTFFTVGAWAVVSVGFALYLKISNLDKLYGALSAVIVFLLWLYVLMICFIVGVILNSEKITKQKRELNKERKERREKDGRKKLAVTHKK